MAGDGGAGDGAGAAAQTALAAGTGELKVFDSFRVGRQSVHAAEAGAFHATRRCTDLPFAALFAFAMFLQATRVGQMLVGADDSWHTVGFDSNGQKCAEGSVVLWCMTLEGEWRSECFEDCPDRRSLHCDVAAVATPEALDAILGGEEAVVEEPVTQNHGNITKYEIAMPHCLPTLNKFRIAALRNLLAGPQGVLFVLQQLQSHAPGNRVLLGGINVAALVLGYTYLYGAAFFPKQVLFTTVVVPSVASFCAGAIWLFRDRQAMIQWLIEFTADLTDKTVLEDPNVQFALTHVGAIGDRAVESAAGFLNTTKDHIYNTTLTYGHRAITKAQFVSQSGLKILPVLEFLGGDLGAGLVAMVLGVVLMKYSKHWKRASAYGLGTCQVAGECIRDVRGFWVVSVLAATMRFAVVVFQYTLIVVYLSSKGEVELLQYQATDDFFGKGPLVFSIYFFNVSWEHVKVLLVIMFTSSWVANSLQAFERFLFIYASQVWYVHWEVDGTGSKHDPSWTIFPILRGMYIGIRYHFGTIVAYALLGEPWEFVRFWTEKLYIALASRQWMERKAKSNISKCLTMVVAVFLKCLKRMIVVCPRCSLVCTILNSDGFISGTFRAYEIVKNDHIGIQYLSVCSRFFQNLGSCTITFLCGYMTWLIARRVPIFATTDSWLYIPSPSALAIAGGFCGYFLSISITSILDHVGETILFSWALDREYRAIKASAKLIHEHPQLPHFIVNTMAAGPPTAGRIFMGPNPAWDKEDDDDDEVVGRELTINVKYAKGLRAMDQNWFYADCSDPYVHCEAIGFDGSLRSTFRTETINATLEPEWDHNGTITDFQEGDSLVFTVWDDDYVGDNIVGTVTVEDADLKPFYYFDGLLEVDQGPEHPPGKLKVTIRGAMLPSIAISAPKSLMRICWCCSCCISCCQTLSWCCVGKVRTFFLIIFAITAITGYVGLRMGFLQTMLGTLTMYVYVGAIGLGILLLALYSLYEMITGFFDFMSEQLTFLVRVGISGLSSLTGIQFEEQWKARRSPLPDEYGMVTLIDDGDYTHNDLIQRMSRVIEAKKGDDGAYLGLIPCCRSRR